MKESKIICFGEILWDNLKEGRRLGGAPLNVCYHLQKMGIKSAIITRIGDDRNGRDILAELQKLQVDTTFCTVSKELPTSTVEVHLKENHQVDYEIVENVAWDEMQTTPEMEQAVSEADAFVFGSLVTRSQTSRQTLMALLEKSRYRVFDVNLRAPFYRWEIIQQLLQKTNLLKLNEDELQIIMEWLKQEDSIVEEQLERLQGHFQSIDTILLTQGARGAQCYSQGKHEKVQALKVNVKDTVGSGDAFLAAFLAGKFSGKTIGASLEQASLLSGFVATHDGACPHYEKQDLLSLRNAVQSL
ncbi:carbohydrate kinase [Flavisolibacter sp. BT320]|nr:carbohydrate kinase [Flavisolibacter longurius]